jgi:hypothetical protein
MHTVDDPDDLARLYPDEQSRYGAAAEHALRRYPGPVGDLIHRELFAYARFGRRFATDALIPNLMKYLLTPHGPSPDGDDSTTTEAALASWARLARERPRDEPSRPPDVTYHHHPDGNIQSVARYTGLPTGFTLWPSLTRRPGPPAEPETED